LTFLRDLEAKIRSSFVCNSVFCLLELGSVNQKTSTHIFFNFFLKNLF